MKKIRRLINMIRFDFIIGVIVLVFIGERSRLMAFFGGIFLLLSAVEFTLQFLCEIDERRKNGESDIYKAKGRGTLREVRGKAGEEQPFSEMRVMHSSGTGGKGEEVFLDEEKGRS
jgi:hypothetical protein